MSHLCCVDGCSKIKAGGASDESDFRCFIRWYKFPKNQALQKKWIKRVKRPPSELNTQSMFVCSDHFEDDDFVYRNLLQAEMLSSSALAGHHIKLKDDAVPNTDRKTGRLRSGPPKAERALKRNQNIITADTSGKSSPSRKRKCKKLSLKNVDDLIWENETIIGRLPSMSTVQRNIKLKTVNELISDKVTKMGDVPSTGKVSRKFSLKNIDELISENEAIIGDLQSMTKSTVSLLHTPEPSTDATITENEVKIKEEVLEACEDYMPESTSKAMPPPDNAVTHLFNVKAELVESSDVDNPNLSVNPSIAQLMSEFQSMIGDLPSTSGSTGISSLSSPAYKSHLVSSNYQSVKVKEEPLDLSYFNDSKNLSLKKIDELLSENKAVIDELPSKSAAMMSAVSDRQDSQIIQQVPVKKEPIESSDPSGYAENINIVQNVNNLITESAAIMEKLPDGNAELYFDFEHDPSSPSAAPVSPVDYDPSVDERTTKISATAKEEPMESYYSDDNNNFSLKNIDKLISENEAIVGGSIAPSGLISSEKGRQFDLSNIDELISENEAVVGNAMMLRPTPLDTFPDEIQPVQPSVSNKVIKSNIHASPNLRNIDEIISENEAIIGSLPSAATRTHSLVLPCDPTTDVSNHVNKKRNLSVGYIDELISENEAILGTLPSENLYHQKINFAAKY